MNKTDIDRGLRLYRGMLEIRAFDAHAGRLYLWGKTQGPVHLSMGQEAIATGFADVLRPDDLSYATYRGHGHALARGVSWRAAFAEMMGKASGLMGAKGGSMHMIDPARGLMGCNAIIGAHLTIATGSAWAAAQRGTGQVVLAFFGEGTTNIGAFHEALNLASVWSLPVVFICENNLYSEYTLTSSVTPVEHPAADRASAYGLERLVIDGNDVDVVRETAERVVEQARSGRGPQLIEAMTYRHSGHAAADPAKYRRAEEVAAWKQRDPLVLTRERLVDAGVAGEELDAIGEEVKRTMKAAAVSAQESGPPHVSGVERDVWADGGASWLN